MATVLPFQRPGSATAMPKGETSAASGTLPEAAQEATDAWEVLMARAQDGDRVAYHALLSGITPYLQAIATRYLGRGEDAEDAVQDILVIVHDLRHTYERDRPFKPWLGTIATRRSIDMLRRRSRRLKHEVVFDDELEHVREPSPEPEEAAWCLQDGRTVREAVERLSPKQKEAIRLVHLDELSLSEASARSQQSTGALKVACHRALRALRKALEKQGKDHD
jgi:RNA polymerase sigma-70 factor, ECF subfamily